MAGVSSCQNALSSLNIDLQERTQPEDSNQDPMPMIGSPRRASMDAIREKAAVFERTQTRPRVGDELTKSTILEAGKLTEKPSDCIPVTAEKDASSDIPDIGMKELDSNSIPAISAPTERTQAEVNNADSESTILEDSAAKRRITECNSIMSQKKRVLSYRPQTGPIFYLDFWNLRDDPMRMVAEKAAIEGTLIRGMDKKRTEEYIKMYSDRTIKEVWELREMRPDHITVIVEKDASSDLPDIDVKKYDIPGAMPLGEFVHVVIRLRAKVKSGKRIFVSFKSTIPPTGALMSTIFKENEDADEYLHITYSGEENACGSIDHEQHWLDNTPLKVIPKRSRVGKPA